MAQAIENWADLLGSVREIRPHCGAPQMSELVLAVERADDVEGFPNAFAETPGNELPIAVETGRLEQAGIGRGDRVRVRVERASPSTVVAHPEGLAKG
jgi:hypothetical protein